MNIWVLPGCGARGAVVAGVLAQLMEKEGPPDLGVGCSSGALNIAGNAHVGPYRLFELWESIRKRQDVFADRWLPWKWSKKAPWDSEPLREKIASVVRVGPPAYPYTVVYSDFKRKCAQYLAYRDAGSIAALIDAVLASASIPGLVPPVGGYMADGGVFEIAPLKYAIDQAPPTGAKITVILGQPIEPEPEPDFCSRNVFETIAAALDGLTTEVLRGDMEYCLELNGRENKKTIQLRLIQPPREFRMGVLEFTPEAISRAFQLGLMLHIPPFSA